MRPCAVPDGQVRRVPDATRDPSRQRTLRDWTDERLRHELVETDPGAVTEFYASADRYRETFKSMWPMPVISPPRSRDRHPHHTLGWHAAALDRDGLHTRGKLPDHGIGSLPWSLR